MHLINVSCTSLKFASIRSDPFSIRSDPFCSVLLWFTSLQSDLLFYSNPLLIRFVSILIRFEPFQFTPTRFNLIGSFLFRFTPTIRIESSRVESRARRNLLATALLFSNDSRRRRVDSYVEENRSWQVSAMACKSYFILWWPYFVLHRFARKRLLIRIPGNSLLFYVSSISLDLLYFVVLVDREKTIFFMMYLYMSHLSLKRERFRIADLSKIRSSSLICFLHRRIDSFRD